RRGSFSTTTPPSRWSGRTIRQRWAGRRRKFAAAAQCSFHPSTARRSRAARPAPRSSIGAALPRKPISHFSCRSVAGGVIGAPVEATERVLAERRMAILRRLAVAEADTADQACRATAEIVEAHPRDFSFALIYRINAGA